MRGHVWTEQELSQMREYKGDALAMAAKLGLTPRQVR